MKIAQVDQTIISKEGIVGVVEKVKEQSVLIKILENPTDTDYPDMRTIINHKNYKIK